MKTADTSEARNTTRAWLAVGVVALGIFTLMTTKLLPVGLLDHIAADQGVRI